MAPADFGRAGWRVGLAALGVAITHAFAADGESVKRPYIEEGDCWSYRAENVNFRGSIGEYESCVTHVDASKNLIFAVAKLKSDGREIDTTYSRDWGAHLSINGNIYLEGLNMLRFPLQVGDTHVTETSYRRALYGQNAGTIKLNVKVVKWEDVAVPAGKFRALKVESRGFIYRSDIPSTPASLSIDIWYVPEVGRHVKVWVDGVTGISGEELTSYKLKK